jgi:hypothetical protein
MSDHADSGGTLVEHGELQADSGVRAGEGPAHGALLASGDGRVAGDLAPSGPAQSLQAKRLAALARVDDRIRTRNARIVADAALGPNFDPAGPKPEGMSERKWRVIKASWANMKAAPTWLTQAYRVTESYKKAEADRPAAPTINAEVVQVHVSVANYPRRRLSEE